MSGTEKPDPLVSIGTTQPIHTLRPDQCLIKLVGDTVKCLREIGPDHPAHDPKAPIGATRRNIEKYLEEQRARLRVDP
jgi:hypothetical protein